MKRIALTIICLWVGALAMLAAHSVTDIPNVHVADRTAYVSNPDGVLSASAVAQLNQTLAQIWQTTTAEPVVVAVDDIDSDDVDDFATRLFEEWGIGKSDKDNGVLVLIVKDKHKAVIRTGYGAEGVLPDIVCGRLLRNVMFPAFRQGNYDEGTISTVKAMSDVLTNPEAAEELKSRYANDARHSSGDDMSMGDLFEWFLGIAGIMGLICLIVVLWEIMSTRKMEPTPRYQKLETLRTPMLFFTFLGLGMPIVAYLILVAKLKRLRNRPRICPNCGARMNRLDEDTDNLYLTPAQDTEERINSIDYDVWLCPKCNETDIIPYVNRQAPYSVCEKCGARACQLTADRIIAPPTTSREGYGEKTYTCRSCGHNNNKGYKIPKKVDDAAIVAGAVAGAMLGSRRGGGFGGGGFSGGSFGGGSTGGGGASGGW